MLLRNIHYSIPQYVMLGRQNTVVVNSLGSSMHHCSGNTLDYIILVLGALRRGITIIPVNPAMKKSEDATITTLETFSTTSPLLSISGLG